MGNSSSTENKIRLLICTQVIDKNDGVLGFFHGWMLEFSKSLASLVVICLKKGDYDVVDNTKVFSLGKETHSSRFLYVVNFYRNIIKQRHSYDAVLVHMNKEYVVLGYIVWKILGKKILFWYNHPLATLSARIAAHMADQVVYTSPSSYFGRHGIGKQMPVGVDTELFNQNDRYPRAHTILSLGRIAPVKNTLLLAESFVELIKKGIPAHLILAGEALPQDAEYKKKIETLLSSVREHVTYTGAIPHHTAPQLFKTADVFVNLTPSGSLDKTIFEAMAAGCIVVTSNDYVSSLFSHDIASKLYVPLDTADTITKVTQALETALGLSDTERNNFQKDMREIVIRDHSLNCLVKSVAGLIGKVY